jgi:mono/diheme cytochrome c family protein
MPATRPAALTWLRFLDTINEMRILAVLPAALLIAQFAAAQPNPPSRTVWDGAFTELQAERGYTAFTRNCSNCHVLATEGRAPLVGDSFWKSFSQKTVGDMLEYISNSMPNGNPRSLGPETYADIVAAILKANGFPAGPSEVERGTVANILVLPRDGSTALPANALGRVVGCLTRSGTDWVMTKATAPERAERVRPAGEDASRALGTRTIPLKFVLTKLDSMAGARVAVSGLLIGANGAEGINVTAVNRVAEKCQ